MSIYQFSHQMSLLKKNGDQRDIQSITYLDEKVNEESLEDIGEDDDQLEEKSADLSRQEDMEGDIGGSSRQEENSQIDQHDEQEGVQRQYNHEGEDTEQSQSLNIPDPKISYQ